jgi:hypothetical protein
MASSASIFTGCGGSLIGVPSLRSSSASRSSSKTPKRSGFCVALTLATLWVRPVWELQCWEDILKPDGTIDRKRESTILGYASEMTVKQARKEAEKKLSPVNAGKAVPSFEIVAPLGAGGMGEVYRARDTTLKRDVAIKVLPEYWSRDPERLHRFEQEATAFSRPWATF